MCGYRGWRSVLQRRWSLEVCTQQLCDPMCRIYERLKAEKQAEDDARDERERLVDLMYQEQVHCRDEDSLDMCSASTA